jgi:hypothetical protein
VAVAVEMLAASADQPATEHDELRSARERWSSIALGARDRAEAGAWAALRSAGRFSDRSGVALGFAAAAVARTSVQAARSGRHGAAVAGRVAGQAGARTGRTVRSASIRAGRATGRASMRAGGVTGQASAGVATKAGAAARRGSAALAATAATIGASTLAAIGAGIAATGAFVRRASAATHRTGARTAGGTARAVRRGGGRATVATRRGTRRAAAATRRAAIHLVPDPVALPTEAGERDTRAEPEPAAVETNSAPAPAVGEPAPAVAAPDPAVAAAAPRAAQVVSPGDGQRPPLRRRPRPGQVVPLRPRATTRLKATGELLLLVALLGLVVSSIIVALAVAGNHVLSGL